MEVTTLSIHYGTSSQSVSLKHNLNAGGMRDREREEDGHYIDHTRTADNIELARNWSFGKTFKENVCALQFDETRTVGQLLDDVLEDYNAGKRKSRQMTKEKLFSNEAKSHIQHQEVIIQLGKSTDQIPEAVAVDFLKDAFKVFQDMHPWAHVTSAVIHLDEMTPHLHITYVPIMEREATRGLPLSLSLSSCVGGDREGFVAQREEFEMLLSGCARARGYYIDNPGTGRNHESFKDWHEREALMNQAREIEREAERLHAQRLRELDEAHKTLREAKDLLERVKRGESPTEPQKELLEREIEFGGLWE